MTDVSSTRLSDTFSNTAPSTHPQKWEDLWADDYTPWDRGTTSSGLVALLSSPSSKLPSSLGKGRKVREGRKKALVPGCGRGYDVLLLSAWGFDAYGLDVSETALTKAGEVEKELAGKGVCGGKDGVEKGSVNWVAGDFFADEFLEKVEGEKKFDLIYDYTFLSALPPALRPAWAKRYQELLAPGGRLICLEWPTHKPASTEGPPWALPSKIYLAHLGRPGKELLYADNGNLEESSVGEQTVDGLQRVEYYQPEETHKAGYVEGKMTDWISIWAHPTSA